MGALKGFLEKGLVPTMIQIIKSIHLIKQLRIYLNFTPHVAITFDERNLPRIKSKVKHLINEKKFYMQNLSLKSQKWSTFCNLLVRSE